MEERPEPLKPSEDGIDHDWRVLPAEPQPSKDGDANHGIDHDWRAPQERPEQRQVPKKG